ncbi:NAD(P)H-dependent oxidoreductase [Flammeovirga sp. SubArs3]|uniref:NAD(P)H-dependent oxidoreductase n=1 Tax=Flammeovirga sp. SubArs3 TaxID=2995316 RepID=UPI00248C40F5|nr:NAD(P)H-dependent oxidoreductase [Flammeovirga sp. SubArs3]
MNKILVINAGQKFMNNGGTLNNAVADFTINYFKNLEGFDIKYTHIEEGYDIEDEISKMVWADIIIYHTPIWWFSLPFGFKKYLDEVLTSGSGKIYASDGRHRTAPKLNYGSGGLLKGKKYILTTTWNAPEEAFTTEGEIFQQTNVDNGVMFGFHKMNLFIGLENAFSFHFYDVLKDPKIEDDLKNYQVKLDHQFKK